MILEILKSYQQEECSVESVIERYIHFIMDEDSNYKSIIHLSQISLQKAKCQKGRLILQYKSLVLLVTLQV